MRNANWTPVYKSYDVNESLTRFFHTFNSISNSHAPLKSINIKKSPTSPGWRMDWENQSKFVTSSIKNGWQLEIFIIISNIKFIETGLLQLIKPFEPYTTIVYLRTPQKQKQKWDNVNLIISKNRPSSNIDNLKVKDKNLQQPFSISNAINRYLCNIYIFHIFFIVYRVYTFLFFSLNLNKTVI